MEVKELYAAWQAHAAAWDVARSAHGPSYENGR